MLSLFSMEEAIGKSSMLLECLQKVDGEGVRMF